MKKVSLIPFNKVIAGVLLVLFTFIHVEKAFHTHNSRESHSAQKGLATSFNNSGCAICDFQLAKDSEIPVLSVTHLPIIFVPQEFASTYISYQFLHLKQSINKGPPAC